MKSTEENWADLRREHTAKDAEIRRKAAMVQHHADIHLEVRAASEGAMRRLVTAELYPLVDRAAREAGDVLTAGQKQQNAFGGFAEPADRPGVWRHTAMLRFVSDTPDREAASAWLRNVLDHFRHDDITIVDLEPYTGLST
jgi:hypothetical protein